MSEMHSCPSLVIRVGQELAGSCHTRDTNKRIRKFAGDDPQLPFPIILGMSRMYCNQTFWDYVSEYPPSLWASRYGAGRGVEATLGGSTG